MQELPVWSELDWANALAVELGVPLVVPVERYSSSELFYRVHYPHTDWYGSHWSLERARQAVRSKGYPDGWLVNVETGELEGLNSSGA